MARIDIRGDIVTNDYRWIYDWFGLECCCPADVRNTIEATPPGETIDVYINSPGGLVTAGQEIYSELRGDSRVLIHITGEACSAASMIAMAGRSDITPAGLLMIHRASIGGVDGNRNDMEQAMRMLDGVDAAIASAYAMKSGKTMKEIIKMMDSTSWLTAEQCVEMGLIDSITPAAAQPAITNALGGLRITEEMVRRAKTEKAMAEAEAAAAEQKLKLANDILKDLDTFGV